MKTYAVKNKEGVVLGTIQLKPRGNVKHSWFKHAHSQLKKSKLFTETAELDTLCSFTSPGEYCKYLEVRFEYERGRVNLGSPWIYIVELQEAAI